VITKKKFYEVMNKLFDKLITVETRLKRDQPAVSVDVDPVNDDAATASSVNESDGELSEVDRDSNPAQFELGCVVTVKKETEQVR